MCCIIYMLGCDTHMNTNEHNIDICVDLSYLEKLYSFHHMNGRVDK
jgi:hypothetical protein